MCTQFTPLNYQEAQAVVDAFNAKQSIFLQKYEDWNTEADVFPGKSATIFLPDPSGGLTLTTAHWGFKLDSNNKLYFNTRIETAIQQHSSGRGMWAKAIRQGRCLVPARAFYECHKTDVYFDEETGKQKSYQYRIQLEGSKAFLMAGIFQDGVFSVITTPPNGYMASIHDRMPLVLGKGESSIWLGSDFASLIDRSHISLVAKSVSE